MKSMVDNVEHLDSIGTTPARASYRPESAVVRRSDAMPSSRPAPRQEPKVLVVEASFAHFQEIAEVLDTDYELSHAASAEQALRQCQQARPDLVLLATRLPGIHGVELCREVKRHGVLGDDTPVILMSQSASAVEETAALLAGAVDFISKPLNPAVLRARVGTHVKLKQQADILREQAYLDALTSLANRRRFDQQFELEWRACLRDECPLGLVLLDVDFFKQYNDLYGHQKGDQILRKVSRVFDQSLRRPRDFVARFGGEEFVCLMPGDDLDKTRRSARYLLDNLVQQGIPHAASSVGPYVTMSAGVAAVVPQAGASPDDLLREADARLYQAKLNGRACVVAGPAPDAVSGLQLISV